MSRFISPSAAALAPYVPGEQPADRQYIKLNTNECPYPPAPAVAAALERAAREAALYPDPEAGALREAIAEAYGLRRENVLAANGSDEAIALACMTFFERGDAVYFPVPSYGFYPVYAQLFGLRARPLPLAEDFTVNVDHYIGLEGNIIIANPNAPTGIALPCGEIERILRGNPDRLVVVDEAYVDFAGDGVTALPLLEDYDNLLIIGTFSKSRAMAGLRLGYILSRPEHIAALERVRFSFHPYNVSRATQLAGIAAARDAGHLRTVLTRIVATRERVAEGLRAMGLEVLPSSTNFLFCALPGMGGGELGAKLREKGILVRWLDGPRTAAYIRVSIGNNGHMDAFLRAVREIIASR